MNFARNIPSKYILLLIVTLGFLLRVNRLTIGFPMLYVSQDEALYHLSALNMLANGTLFTIGNYGPLGAYVQFPFLVLASAMLFIEGKIHNLHDIQFLLLTQEGYMLFVPRVISAMFGTLSILAVYWLTRDFFNKKSVALWSAFLAAVSFNLVHVSHMARGWAPAIFFVLVAVNLALKSVFKKRDELKNTFGAFAVAAVAFGFHQLSGMAIVLIVLIRIFGKQFKKSNILSKLNLYGFLLWFFLIFIFNYLSLGKNFFALINPHSPQNQSIGLIAVPENIGRVTNVLAFLAERGTFTKLPRDLILSDGLIIVLAAVFFLKKRVSKIYLSFLIFFAFNLILIATILPALMRYFLIVFALLPTFAGNTISSLANRRHSLFIVLPLIMVISFNAFWWNVLILKKTTFEETRDWLAQNISPNTPIAAIGIRTLGYTPSRDAANVIRTMHPGYYRVSSSLIGDSYPKNVQNVIYIGQFDRGSELANLEAALKVYPIKYYVSTYLNSSQRLINEKTKVKLRLVAHFSPTGEIIYDKDIPSLLLDAGNAMPLTRVNRAGPYIDILAIN